METLEHLKKKYQEFLMTTYARYTSNFPRPVRKKIVYKESVDPIVLAVIKARIDGIINEMTEVVLRTSRNPILYAAKDFTCSLLSYDCRLLSMANSLPGHLLAMDAPLWAIVKAFGKDIHPGDAFINNDPYYGNSHLGDFQMYAPIFHDGEIIAWSGSLCHLIDCGAHNPTNLDPTARDVYEEGMHFPPMRICQDYEEIPEMIRFIKANFRYPDEWYGDFLAQIGSIRKGGKRVMALCRKYGGDVVKQCEDELIDYGNARMSEEISRLPKGVWHIEGISEALAPVSPEGFLMKLTMAVDPDELEIIFDLTEMPDQLPWGHNLSWATSRIACLQGSMPAFDPSLPRNSGVYQHFHIIQREGSVIGMPKWPAATCCATTNITDEVSNLVLNLWEQVETGRGHGGNGEINTSLAVGSGIDFRRDNEPFGHMYFMAISAGGASNGNDGWGTMINNSVQGNMFVESVEEHELKIPNIVWEIGIRTDGGGVGKWRGGPGFYHRIQPRENSITLHPFSTGHTCVPRGVAGGGDGTLGDHWLEKHDAPGVKTQQLRNTGMFQVGPDEDWVAITNGGGGYGDPLERDAEAVRDDARNYIVSVDAAKNVYGVVLNTETELYNVDHGATKKMRARLIKERGAR